ncbi:MAG: hypothetical protein AAGE86_11650 [Pseudomonadota bacterium]
MQGFLALEAWVILLAAPCLLSWILGEMHGAARVRSLVEGVDAGDADLPRHYRLRASSDVSVALQQKQSAKAEAAMLERRAVKPFEGATRTPIDGAVARVEVPQPIAASSECGDVFANMPTPEQEREEADWLSRELETLWSDYEADRDPAIVEAMGRYRESMSGLSETHLPIDPDIAPDAPNPPMQRPEQPGWAHRNETAHSRRSSLPDRSRVRPKCEEPVMPPASPAC